MTDEGIIKGYDPAIMRRLLGFLKPYRLLFTVAVVALLLATAAELALPVVLKNAIDRHIIVKYRRFEEEGLRSLGFGDQKIFEDATPIEGFFYIPLNQLNTLSAKSRESLIEEGVLDEESWYIFPIGDRRESLRVLLQNKRELFVVEENHGAIRNFDLKLLRRSERQLIRSHDTAGVARSSLIYFVLLTCVLLFSFAQVYIMAYTGQSVMKDMRMRLFRHTIAQSLAFIGRNPIGSLVTRSTNDVETINELFSTVATSLIKDLSIIIGVTITLFLLDPRLAGITILTIPPIVVATILFRRRLREAYRRVRMWVSRVNAFLSEHISGIAVVQMFGRERRSMKEFLERSRQLLKANLAEMHVTATFRPLVDLFASVSVGVVIYFGAGLHRSDFLTLGILIAFINLVGRFYQPIQDISEKFTVMQSAMAGGERVFDLLDTDESIPDAGIVEVEGRNAFDSFVGKIRFREVRFSYREGEPILRNLSFDITPGETVAIVGYTGAGKTTIINLLTRLWDIQSGRIEVDGIDIMKMPLKQLRTLVQPVQQDVFLFSGSIGENISLGRELSREDLRRAAKAVNIDGFISGLSHGYDTLVQEGGGNFSVGQRQLISFARVIAFNPKIVVLDEATSNIDTETEKLIQGALKVVLSGRTSLVIAHRLSTIQDADRILVLNRGELVEQGNHEELIALKGSYFDLHQTQLSRTRGDADT